MALLHFFSNTPYICLVGDNLIAVFTSSFSLKHVVLFEVDDEKHSNWLNKDLTDPQRGCQGPPEVFTSHSKYNYYKTAGVNQKCKYSKDLGLRTTDPQTAKGTYIG